jgi:hypothetical protein
MDDFRSHPPKKSAGSPGLETQETPGRRRLDFEGPQGFHHQKLGRLDARIARVPRARRRGRSGARFSVNTLTPDRRFARGSRFGAGYARKLLKTLGYWLTRGRRISMTGIRPGCIFAFRSSNGEQVGCNCMYWARFRSKKSLDSNIRDSGFSLVTLL